MKPTELMFSDIVSIVPSGQQIRIAAIHKIKVAYHSVEHRLEWVRMSLIRPIPLTYKILEKNGFSGEGYMTLDLDDSSYLEYYGFEGRLRKIWNGVDEWNNHSASREITFQCHCKYVHELQHALRMCELNELADNLKV